MNYVNFGKTGLRVSQLALGTGNFGTGWGHGADPDVATSVFNAYAEAGGNLIDTADVYQVGQSEEMLGTLLEGRRENFVLATKYANGSQPNADRLVTGAGQVAIAWAGTHGAIPIIGPRSLTQLKDKLGALSLELSTDHLTRLDGVSSLVSLTLPNRACNGKMT